MPIIGPSSMEEAMERINHGIQEMESGQGYSWDSVKAELFDSLYDDQPPYTLEELNTRIDEAEAEMERGEGKSFVEMMNGFKEELLWLK